MSRNRSDDSVVQSAIDIKTWQQRQPTVEEVRPARCPSCGHAAHPVGGLLRLHGHGTRERQVRGPGEPGQAPTTVVLLARRYRCQPCRAVIVVVPREVRARRLYSAAAIGFALALWGLVQATAAEVRRRISPATIVGATAAMTWATLRRWTRAVAQRRLFPFVPLPATATSLREVAASAAASLAAHADPTTRDEPLAHRTFLGAAHAA